jgi:hypothetical protein
MITLKQTGERFHDIYSARDAVVRFAQSISDNKKTKAELLFDDGEYVLDKSVVFSVKKNEALSRISLSLLCEKGNAKFTSLQALDKNRFENHNGTYIYHFKKDENGKYPIFRDLYIDGKRIDECRSEIFFRDINIMHEQDEEKCGFYIPESVATLLPDVEFNFAKFTLYAEWEFLVFPLLMIARDDVKTDENGDKHVFAKIEPSLFKFYSKHLTEYLKQRSPDFFLSGHPSLLKNNTWCYDHKNGVIYYRAESMPEGDICVPMLEQLFVFDEMQETRLENLKFSGTTDKMLCENGYFSGQANVEKRLGGKAEESAVTARGVCGFYVENCCFSELGTNAILVSGESARVYVHRTHFENIAMSAVSIGDPVSIYRNKRYCSFDVRLEDNYLYNIGYDFPSSPAIDVFRVDGLSICRNTIEYCAYSGISVGWNWATVTYSLGEVINIRDAKIADNKIFHFMQVLRDGGAIYVVGGNCTTKDKRFFNFMHGNFAYCDSVKKTVRGFYLDGSSSNWHVYNNVISGAQRPMFTQFIVDEEVTYNNLVENIYMTEEAEPENHAPERNNIYKNMYFAPTMEDLCRKYPKVCEIYENSGCGEK